MRPNPHLSSLCFLFLSACLVLAGCGPSPEEQSTLTATAQTATAAAWTRTPTSTRTFTPTSTLTPTSTFTPTSTSTPTASSTHTITQTPTITPSPTFDFPKVTVNKAAAACRFGPAKAYLWARDLRAGDTGVVWGRAPYGSTWLYVRMDRLDGACWVAPSVVDVVGDIHRVIVQPVRLWITNALYSPPTNVRAERQGDQVTVSWGQVMMTLDDDRGYFLDVWVCQNGNYVWIPVGLPDQYTTSFTFTDQPGCSQPSGGKLYAVEKHGYISPVDIPWPP